jgi:hypothetical protein
MKCNNIKGMEMTGKNQSTEYNVFKKNLGSVKKWTDIRVTYMTVGSVWHLHGLIIRKGRT